MKQKILSSIFLIIIATAFSGCGIYSFSGASISPDTKTISIHYFPNRASIVQPSLSQSFTEALRDKFMSQTRLDLVADDGDLDISGEIVSYSTQPVAIQGNDAAALNRLTITVKVKFINQKDPKQNFETPLSRFAQYESSRNLKEVEDQLIKQINTELVEDIFNRTVVNW